MLLEEWIPFHILAMPFIASIQVESSSLQVKPLSSLHNNIVCKYPRTKDEFRTPYT